ncbi:DUF1129 family protein [Paenibacillus segetis]|uniref:DUF1129 family protein n=1 Tax=Paenibacillus segetis TaxID=1325360 RepID=A0ABQ1Y2J5_9BACL|nr:DUF1129 family protein [Paenibacillus segetis]GGH10001.1 hypothetical protein GCM10008013_01200 [Paenibacillus segetis]
MSNHDMDNQLQKLSQQMNPANQVYFEEMLNYISPDSTTLSRAKREEILTDLAKKIIKNQKKAIQAQELFGEDAVAYCKDLIEDVLMRKPRTLKDKIKYYTMIPWVALTWLFFIYMITGFMGKWFEGELEYTEINASTLLLIAVLSIVLIEAVTRFLGPGPKEEESNEVPRKFDLKALGIYIGVAVVLIAVFMMLGQLMPTFTISPWGSLILFLVGVVGHIFIFGRRGK